MKTFNITFLLLLTAANFSFISAQAQQYMTSDSAIHLWGVVKEADLVEAPFEWLPAQRTPSLPIIPSWASGLHDMEVDIYLGTWCGDSEEWVPAFVELWQSLGQSTEELHFIALHNQGDNYKQGPDGETLGLNIHRVPTFVFRRNSSEVGRIVERPLNNLETDVRQIAQAAPSAPRYRAVQRLHQLFLEQPLDSIYANSRVYLNEINREVSGPGELNTYGYVLKAQGRAEEAMLVFRMNTALFRYTPNCYDSLGELYVDRKEWDKAKGCYEEVIRLKGEDERASEMLVMIEQERIDK